MMAVCFSARCTSRGHMHLLHKVCSHSQWCCFKAMETRIKLNSFFFLILLLYNQWFEGRLNKTAALFLCIQSRRCPQNVKKPLNIRDICKRLSGNGKGRTFPCHAAIKEEARLGGEVRHSTIHLSSFYPPQMRHFIQKALKKQLYVKMSMEWI